MTRAGLPADWDREVRLTPANERDRQGDVVEVSLTAEPARVGVGAQHAELWTYNGMSPGPLIRVPVGARLRVHFKNDLPEPTTIHWHGLEVPAVMDGADPEHGQVKPGETFEYEFVVPHAGTYWYHPHMNSAEQVWRGLYGALIVEDPNEPVLGAEVVLVLHDLALDGEEPRALSPDDNLGAYFGREGDVLLVNGRVRPRLRVAAGTALRLRLVNAAVSRYFRLGLDGHDFVRVAGDSGFVEQPETTRDLLLVPGERAEVVVVPKGEPGRVLDLSALPYERFDCAGCEQTRALASIEIVDGQGSAPEIPERLAEIAPIDTTGAVDRTLTLMESTRGAVTILGLNGQFYPDDPLEFHASVGDTEVWTVENSTEYDHPFHLHGFRFQVLDVRGAPLANKAWKDTLNIPARSQAKIAMTFDDRPGMWMMHCHILDHAELGMMGMLHVMGD